MDKEQRLVMLNKIKDRLELLLENYVEDFPGHRMLSMACSFVQSVWFLEDSDCDSLGHRDNVIAQDTIDRFTKGK